MALIHTRVFANALDLTRRKRCDWRQAPTTELARDNLVHCVGRVQSSCRFTDGSKER